MNKLRKSELGFGIVEGLLIIVIIGVLGFTGWFVYNSRKNTDKNADAQSTSQTTNTSQPAELTAKAKAMASWLDFSNTTVNLKFRYPSEWGQAKFEVMNSTPSDTNGTFYKVSFDKRTYTDVTITPKAAVKDYSTTFANLKTDNTKYASTRHVFADEQTVVGAIVPSSGNQDAEIYAARSISLSKVDASDIVLFDAKKYDSTCNQASYASACYTTDELNNYQWLLEDASSL